MNRPERRNALIPEMWHSLADAVRELDADDSIRAIVLSGTGGAFCSGHDIEVKDSGTPDRPPRPMIVHMQSVTEAVMALHRLSTPTVARVVGAAAGGGCGLALACDLVVAADSAKFFWAFAKRGLVPDTGASWWLPRLVGVKAAMELLLLGTTMDAVSAKEMGLVNHVVPVADIDDAVREFTDQLCAGPPVANALTKRLVYRSLTIGLEEALDDEASAQSAVWATRDRREAFKAFLERRDPQFEGA
jgi:2-(1,2-epoxy-1,2-dihydrophenyl)acetyl-CoA isomerase